MALRAGPHLHLRAVHLKAVAAERARLRPWAPRGLCDGAGRLQGCELALGEGLATITSER